MIHHIVMWQLQPTDTQDRELAANLIKTTLESLNGKITQLINLHIGINIDNPHANYDIVLNAQFESMADLADYQQHPEHLAAGEALKPLLANRACVDYQQ